jgi:hypothetical protein
LHKNIPILDVDAVAGYHLRHSERGEGFIGRSPAQSMRDADSSRYANVGQRLDDTNDGYAPTDRGLLCAVRAVVSVPKIYGKFAIYNASSGFDKVQIQQ